MLDWLDFGWSGEIVVVLIVVCGCLQLQMSKKIAQLTKVSIWYFATDRKEAG